MNVLGRWHQCPGCFSASLAAAPEDGWLECECGEKLTDIDLRSAPPPSRGAVEALEKIGEPDGGIPMAADLAQIVAASALRDLRSTTSGGQ